MARLARNLRTSGAFDAVDGAGRCCSCQRTSAQLAKLRQLTQPYFLDTNLASGFAFIWLLMCLLFLVTGIIFVLVSIFIFAFKMHAPDTVGKMVQSDEGLLPVMLNMWHSVGGLVVLSLCLVAAASFYRYRKALHGRWLPWLLLGGVVMTLLVLNIVTTGIGFVARDMTNALTKRNAEEVWFLLPFYGLACTVALPIRSLQYFLTARLALHWRKWLTNSLIGLYMGHRAYYDINPNDEDGTTVDNPDQRMADDTKTFTRESLSFTVGAFDALLTFVLNILVLFSISRKLTATLFGYSGTATVVLIVASHKLVQLNYNQLHYEADFRFGLVHIRNNAEAIAFYAGEEQEQKETSRRFGNVATNYTSLIKWEVIISALRRSYGYAGMFFPYFVLAPAYLEGSIEYGTFIQAKFAFSMVESALAFVISNIDDMAAWWAGISRLEGFQATIEEINRRGEADKSRDVVKKEMHGDEEHQQSEGEQEEEVPLVGTLTIGKSSSSTTVPRRRGLKAASKVGSNKGGEARWEANADASGSPGAGGGDALGRGILLQGVRVQAPGSDEVLVEDLSLSVGPGQRILVVGSSGCGKTSLLRVASGLWRPQVGSVHRPPVGELLFVPQKPYMLLGSLREQLCYPLPQDSFTDDHLRSVLKEVRLPHLSERYPDLGTKQDWPRLLSLGEQQRLAFARLLLNDPKFVVLDEATSALDVATEQALYERLSQKGVAVLSVGHRPTLASYHDHVLHLQGQGAWRLLPTASYDFAAH